MVVWLLSLWLLTNNLGKSKSKAKFSQMFSKSIAINYLSAARLFLFAARDVWFVVALPAFLVTQLGWQHYQIGAFFALWLMGYGAVQTMAPVITGRAEQLQPSRSASMWALLLAVLPAVIALVMGESSMLFSMEESPAGLSVLLIIGLVVFGVIFAINSSLHSYLIVRYAAADGVAMDVGFYYMANAAGRLLGTVLSGWVYQYWGLEACFWISSVFITLAALLSRALPKY
jgi:predicted MFS family arabinose efflux permease